MKKFFVILILLTSLLQAGTINLALAANVSYAIKTLIENFHQHYPDIKVNITLGNSGKLTSQIKYGAPYDIFLSANMAYPSALYAQKLAITKPLVYAKGVLVLLSKTPRDFSQGIAIIKNKDITSIAMANPRTAPYGTATKEFLLNKKLYKNIQSKLIYGESISQTVAYTAKITDLGFIAKSALFSQKMEQFQKEKNWIDLNTQFYTPIKQGIVLLKHAKNNPEAKAFYTFILGSQAKTIFQNYGYITQP